MNRRFFQKAVPLVLLVSLIISIAINIVMVKKVESMHIMGYDSLGLMRIGSETICEMYVSAADDPNLTGEFYNGEALTPLLETMKTGCYQKAPEPTIGSGDGAASYPWVRIETDEGTYAIAVIARVVKITINGESNCYYSDRNIQISKIIRDIALNELETAG